MSARNKQLQTVAVVNMNKNGSCGVFMPDFNVTCHGDDALMALASASATASAIYYYYLDRSVEMPLKTTYSQAESMCKTKGSFATYVPMLC